MEIINRAKKVVLGTEHPAGQFIAALGSGWEKLFEGQPSRISDLIQKEVSSGPSKISELFYSLFLFIYSSLD